MQEENRGTKKVWAQPAIAVGSGRQHTKNQLANIVGYGLWGSETFSGDIREGRAPSQALLHCDWCKRQWESSSSLKMMQNWVNLTHSLTQIKNTGCILRGIIPHHCSICWEMKGVVSWCTQSPACPHTRGRWAQGHGMEAGILQLCLKEAISCPSLAEDTFHYPLPLSFYNRLTILFNNYTYFSLKGDSCPRSLFHSQVPIEPLLCKDWLGILIRKHSYLPGETVSTTAVQSSNLQ